VRRRLILEALILPSTTRSVDEVALPSRSALDRTLEIAFGLERERVVRLFDRLLRDLSRSGVDGEIVEAIDLRDARRRAVGGERVRTMADEQRVDVRRVGVD